MTFKKNLFSNLFVITLASTVALSACKKTEDTVAGGGGGGGGTGSGSGSAALTAADLAGDWTTPYYPVSSTCTQEGSLYYLSTMHFGLSGANTFDYSKQYYTDNRCQTGYFDMESQGSFAMATSLTSAPANGTAMSFVIGASYITPRSNSAVTALNVDCGQTFTLSHTTVTNGFTCSLYPQPAVGAIADAVVVKTSTTQLDFTVFNDAIPGVSHGTTVPTSTSLTYTKY